MPFKQIFFFAKDLLIMISIYIEVYCVVCEDKQSKTNDHVTTRKAMKCPPSFLSGSTMEHLDDYHNYQVIN